ncbi:MAG TPA: hypothetical protein PKX13_09490, partial [Acidiphilium sp.]|nr:hypothetical protein [Acidiphilium sp.]
PVARTAHHHALQHGLAAKPAALSSRRFAPETSAEASPETSRRTHPCEARPECPLIGRAWGAHCG